MHFIPFSKIPKNNKKTHYFSIILVPIWYNISKKKGKRFLTFFLKVDKQFVHIQTTKKNDGAKI
jgi:hypothetical protein